MIFLAGKKRTLAENSRLGFHKQSVAKRNHKPFYEANKDAKGWEDEFEYFNYNYDRLVTELIEDIKFMNSRGVSVDFILNVFSTASDDLWFPSGEVLLSSGVITD